MRFRHLYITALFLGNFIFAQQTQDQQFVEPTKPVRELNTGLFTKSSSSTGSNASTDVDVTVPAESSFEIGKNIEGLIQNSIHQPTGKVIFTLPITTIGSNGLSYNVSLSYNGSKAFNTAQKTNQYQTTGIVGVGFNYTTPKIVANYKSTTTRHDDTFYLLDGNNTKLICTNKTPTLMEFVPENYKPWKIQLHLGANEYWTIIKDDGSIYQFGSDTNGDAKSLISTWGNWIGDSNQTPTGRIAAEWHLRTIKDQWANSIDFTYDVITGRQNTGQFSNYHTEAVYIKEIQSSKGASIVFTYGNKIPQEYFEPHSEKIEPDAYQEKYQKKYLQNVKTYNFKNELVATHKFEYDLMDTTDPTKPYIGKRYLRRYKIENKNGVALPAQEFTYHTSGTYKGGLDKVIYPTGGSVTYSYSNKLLFNNTANRIVGAHSDLSNYFLIGTYTNDNYVLKLYRTKDPVTGTKYRYRTLRYTWVDNNWLVDEYYNGLYPYRTSINNGGSIRYKWLDGYEFIFGENYYGFMSFNRGTNTGNLNLFHLNKDKVTWNQSTFNNIPIESKNEQPYLEDPVFINGNDFVAIGPKRSGLLHTYVWNGSGWNHKQIDQDRGDYYYAANNNFILSFDEEAGVDFVDGHVYTDHYYIHYLDTEKNWQSKSWTNEAQIRGISTIYNASHFFPSNSLTAFIADDNPEFFLRWDTNYNLIGVDDVLGSYDDGSIIYAVNNSMFTLRGQFTSANESVAQHFNGKNWNILNQPLDNNHKSEAFGDNLILNYGNNNRILYSSFNPNTNQWSSGDFGITYPWYYYNVKNSAIAKNFFIAGNYIYCKDVHSLSIPPFQLKTTLQYNNGFSYSNNLNHIFVKQNSYQSSGSSASTTFEKSNLYYMNRGNGYINNIDLGTKYQLGSSIEKFGGFNTFLSSNTVFLRNEGTTSNNVNSFSTYLHRIIDDKIDQSIYDIVVSNIQIDNDKGDIRHVDYSYEDFNFLPNESIYYGKVTVELKGNGNDSNGETITYFDNGDLDVRFIGIPRKIEVKDINGNLKSETNLIPNIYTIDLYNSFNNTKIDNSYYLRTTNKESKLFLEGNVFTTNEILTFNDLGLQSKKTSTNSKGEAKEVDITYANELYTFLNDKNIISKPAKTISKNNNTIVSTIESKWKLDVGKAYSYQNFAGVETTKLLTEVSKVNNFGLSVEENNGKGIFTVNIFGYNYNYPVAQILNASYSEVISNLDVSITSLQTLTTENLKIELLKLYNRLPKASITISLYDNNGNVLSQIDARQEEIKYFYDDFNRFSYSTDSNGNKLNQTEYNYKNN